MSLCARASERALVPLLRCRVHVRIILFASAPHLPHSFSIRVCIRAYVYTNMRVRRGGRAVQWRCGRQAAERGIVTEMLTSWNHFLLSVAKFIGTSKRERRRGAAPESRAGRGAGAREGRFALSPPLPASSRKKPERASEREGKNARPKEGRSDRERERRPAISLVHSPSGPLCVPPPLAPSAERSLPDSSPHQASNSRAPQFGAPRATALYLSLSPTPLPSPPSLPTLGSLPARCRHRTAPYRNRRALSRSLSRLYTLSPSLLFLHGDDDVSSPRRPAAPRHCASDASCRREESLFSAYIGISAAGAAPARSHSFSSSFDSLFSQLLLLSLLREKEREAVGLPSWPEQGEVNV